MKRQIEVDIYNQRVYFFDSTEECAAWAKKNRVDWKDFPEIVRSPGDLVTGLSLVNEGVHALAVDRGSPLSVLAHECVHVSWSILGHSGVFLEPDNNEAQAYLVSWLFRSFLAKMEWKV